MCLSCCVTDEVELDTCIGSNTTSDWSALQCLISLISLMSPTVTQPEPGSAAVPSNSITHVTTCAKPWHTQPVLDALEVLRPNPNSNAAAVAPLLLALTSPPSRAPAVLPAVPSPTVIVPLLLMPPLAVQSLSQRARQLPASSFAAASSARSLEHCKHSTTEWASHCGGTRLSW
jgi:hypothetical protein